MLLIAAIAAGGCGPRDDSAVTGEAVVEVIDLAILESFPVRVLAVLQGVVPDACTEVDAIEHRRDGTTFTLIVHTRRAADVACVQVITPFEATAELDVLGLPAGTYTIVAGEAEASFELLVENSPQEER